VYVNEPFEFWKIAHINVLFSFFIISFIQLFIMLVTISFNDFINIVCDQARIWRQLNSEGESSR
jgi:hypothetical protein